MKRVICVAILVFLLSSSVVLAQASGDSGVSGEPKNDYFRVTSTTLPSGEGIEEIVIAGPPIPPPGYPRPSMALADPHQQDGLSIITSVPAFNWSFGCSATSAAMIAGYYDRNGYPNMYAGPTHGGVMPMDNSYWSDWTDGCSANRHQTPLSATHNGLDGRSSDGHVDDYWVCYGSTTDDPFVGDPPEHTYEDCTGDYMYTNQTTNYGASDGATRFWGYSSATKLYCDTLVGWGGQYLIDGTLGFRNFYKARGYSVSDCFYQKTDNQYDGGFSYDDYKAEIDAGRPVMIHVVGHTMVGFGYDDSSSDLMYIHDTWDYDAHTMIWGESYSGMELVAVSIVQLAPTGHNSAQTGNWHTTSTWDTGTVPGSSNNVTIKSGHAVTVDSNAQIQNLAIEYDGTLVIPDGVTLNVEDTFSNNGTIQQTRNVPDGSTTEFLHITNAAGTTDMYHGLDITPDSTSMGSTTVAIKGNHTGGCTTVPGDALLYRCFEITPGSQESATLKFWYDEDERNGQTANALVVWHHDGGSDWSKVGTCSYSESTLDCRSGDGRECWIEASGISSYSVFDIGNDGAAPTAVTLHTIRPEAAGLGSLSNLSVIALLAVSLVTLAAAVTLRRQSS